MELIEQAFTVHKHFHEASAFDVWSYLIWFAPPYGWRVYDLVILEILENLKIKGFFLWLKSIVYKYSTDITKPKEKKLEAAKAF
jgi:hypothetical protein